MAKADAVFIYIGTYPSEAAARDDYDVRPRLVRVNSSPWFPYTFSGHEFDAVTEPAPQDNFDPRHPKA